jgi:FkbM family methyltransferase
MASFQKLSRGLVVGTQAVGQGLANMSTDMRLLFRTSQQGVVLRQKRLNGVQMIVRAEEEVGREIYYKGIFEGEETRFLRSFISESSVCFDIGANVGYYSLLFASLSPKGSVHSFEPVPLNYHILCANAIVNGFSNVNVNLCAVGEREGSTELVISSDSAYSSLIDTGRKPVGSKVRVRMITLDGYCDQNNVGRVDLLKVDVEGAEARVLCGAQGILGDPERRPRVVMLELYEPMLNKYRTSTEEVSARMCALGYRPFVLIDGSLVPFQRPLHSQLENVVFVYE